MNLFSSFSFFTILWLEIKPYSHDKTSFYVIYKLHVRGNFIYLFLPGWNPTPNKFSSHCYLCRWPSRTRLTAGCTWDQCSLSSSEEGSLWWKLDFGFFSPCRDLKEALFVFITVLHASYLRYPGSLICAFHAPGTNAALFWCLSVHIFILCVN